MKFLELRDRLEELSRDPRYSRAKPDGIWDERYDRGKGIPGEEKWHLRREGTDYLVSWLERGEFVFTQAFATEDDACEWLWSELSKIPPAPAYLPEEQIQAIGEAMRERYAEDLENWPSWPEQEQQAAFQPPWYRRLRGKRR